MSHVLDFDQIGRTCAHNVEEIERAFTRARFLGILIGSLETLRDKTAPAIEELIGEEIRKGGLQEVDDATWDRWVELEGAMCGIWTGLNSVFSHYDHYRGEKAQHDRKVENLAKRPARVRIADGVEPTMMLNTLVAYAPNWASLLADSARHWDEALEAIKERNLVRYNGELQLARHFGTREWNLAKMIEKDKLVAADDEGNETVYHVVLATSGCTGVPKSA